jgi:hypothetical protein
MFVSDLNDLLCQSLKRNLVSEWVREIVTYRDTMYLKVMALVIETIFIYSLGLWRVTEASKEFVFPSLFLCIVARAGRQKENRKSILAALILLKAIKYIIYHMGKSVEVSVW